MAKIIVEIDCDGKYCSLCRFLIPSVSDDLRWICRFYNSPLDRGKLRLGRCISAELTYSKADVEELVKAAERAGESLDPDAPTLTPQAKENRLCALRAALSKFKQEE